MTCTLTVGCVLLAGYLWLCYIGTLLMRLVLVQVVDAAVARYSFAMTFASSMALFLLVLASAAADVDANSISTPFAVPQQIGNALLRHTDRSRAISEDAVATLFRFLLGSLVLQVLVMGPLTLLYMVLWNRLSERHRRRRAERGLHITPSYPLDGELYGGSSVRAEEEKGGIVPSCHRCFCCFYCWPSSTGLRAVCVLLFLLLMGCAALFASQLSSRLMVLVPAVKAITGVVVDYGRHASGLVLQYLTVPEEVQPRTSGVYGGGGFATTGAPAASDFPVSDAAMRTLVEAAEGRTASSVNPTLNIAPHYTAAAAAAASAMLPSLELFSALLEVLTANVGVAGVALMGLLGGYAAVTTPYHFLLSYIYYRKREDTLVQAQLALSRKQRYALNLYASKQRRLATESYHSRSRLAPSQEDLLYDRANVHNERKHRSVSHARRRDGGPARGWLGGIAQRTVSAVCSAASSTLTLLGRGDGSSSGRSTRTSAKDRQQLRMEAEHARNLSLSLYLHMDEVGHMLNEARRGSMWVGKLLAVCGLLLGFYSLVKFALTVTSLYAFRYSTQDPVSRAVALLEAYWVLPPQRARESTPGGQGGMREESGAGAFSLTAVQISTQLVLGLIVVVNAWMIAASIRGLLLTIFQVTLSFTSVVTADTTAVMFAVLMAVYFIGQIIMLRQSLPAPSGASTGALVGGGRGARDTGLHLEESGGGGGGSGHLLRRGEGVNVLFVALGSLPVHFYQRLNDWCFVIGCVATVIARKWVLGDPSKATVSIANG